VQTFLRFVVSACATVCAFLIIPLVLLSPAYGDANAPGFDCGRCACFQDANDPTSDFFCDSTIVGGCTTACDCVLDVNTKKYGCLKHRVVNPV